MDITLFHVENLYLRLVTLTIPKVRRAHTSIERAIVQIGEVLS